MPHYCWQRLLVWYSLNSMGPTPIRTLGMRLSCNFVNVYTIVYHVHCTVHVHVYTRASPTDILARKSDRRTKVRLQVGELNAGRGRRPTAVRAAAGRLSCEDPSAGAVSVSLSVPWNLSFSRQNPTTPENHWQTAAHCRRRHCHGSIRRLGRVDWTAPRDVATSEVDSTQGLRDRAEPESGLSRTEFSC